MRTLVFLLLFANFLFFAYSQGYLGGEPVSETARLEGQVQPERLRLMWRPGEEPDDADSAAFPDTESPDADASSVNAGNDAASSENDDLSASPATASSHEPPLVPPPVPPLVPPPVPATASALPLALSPELASVPPASNSNGDGNTCLLLGNLSVQDADAMEQKVRERKLESRRRGEGSWWVFIPPLANKEGADKKASELTQLGVKDFFIVSDGSHKFAISLGVFSQEEGAQRHLANLRGKGVRSARAEPRKPENNHVSLEVRGATETVNALRRSLPAQLSLRSCQ